MPKTTITASPGGREVVIESIIKAPRKKVWEAYIDPKLFIQWAGPRDLKGRIDTWDLKPGGKYQYTHIAQDGN